MTERTTTRGTHFFLALGLVFAALVIAGAFTVMARRTESQALAEETAAAAVPTVSVTHPTSEGPDEELVLPSTLEAAVESPIYARTSGYLKLWYTDIGTAVKKGQLLAEIEAPEVDQQLRQAEADLGTARANSELARTTNERWQGLLATESVSQQDADQRAGDAAAKAAAQASAAANVARLRELEGFKRVVAPFGGVVTQRNTDVGALINAGETAGSALFRVADTHRLRIYVQVPQAYAAQIRTGMSASLEFTDHPGQHYSAEVASTAHALDAASRTLQVELQIDNARGDLMPGSYVQVTFALPPSPGTLRIPVNAVIFRGKTPQVATVDEAQRVRLRDIAEGRDFGTEIEVLAGITANDTLVLNPPDSIADGQQVRIQPPQPPQGSGAAAAERS